MATNYCNSDDRKLAQFTRLLLGSATSSRLRIPRYTERKENVIEPAEIGTVISSETNHLPADC